MSEEIGNRDGMAFHGRELLEHDLRLKILENAFDFSRPISSETELSSLYSISRNTVRKALQALMNDGLLYKRRGLGTFVIPPEQRRTAASQISNILVKIPDFRGNVRRLNMYDRRLIGGIADSVFMNGGHLELRNHEDSASLLLDQYRSLKFEGIIWERPSAVYYPVIEELHRSRVPQVTISRKVPGVPALFFDYKRGVREVVQFLKGTGHDEIIFLDKNVGEPIFRDRQKVFCDELQKGGTEDVSRNVYLFPDPEGNDSGFARIFQEHPRVTAFFCVSELIPGLYEYLLNLKYCVPGDISLISFSEDADTERICGGVCALREPREQIGRRAVELIRRQKAGETDWESTELIGGEFIVRKSCLSPREILH